ncbi:MAG TPA: fibronectin type III domain-containing protein, partial [Caulobacteraceae bacterium]|nr:fibronectin type III domain-containing protein [Caulobacteraceae bacterium]
MKKLIQNATSTALHPSRRRLLLAAGFGAGAAAMTAGAGGEAAAAPQAPADRVTSPPIAGLHLQFGADASSQLVVSWHTLQSVAHARVAVGRMDGRLEQVIPARERRYVDARSGQSVHAWHAELSGLRPAAAYLYAASHDGAEAEFGTFRTAPRGRGAFTFTSFGDQGTPTVGRAFEPPAGVSL